MTITSTMRAVSAALVGAGALMFGAVTAHAADPIYTGFLSNTAVGGYDVTTFWDETARERGPLRGDSDHSTEWMGATWKFTSAENLSRFVADPERFAPEYGGYCAWAAAMGDLAKGDPKHWAIHDGELYLNFNADIQAKWDADREGFIERADAIWPAPLED